MASLFVTCGELDTVLPTSGTYQINAQVNGVPLSECSLISAKDRINPYFANSVLDDPDVRGLVVFLQTPMGETVGPKIHYALKTAEEPEEQQTWTDAGPETAGEPEEKAETEGDTKTGEEPEDTEYKAPDSPATNTQTAEKVQIAEPVSVKNGETEIIMPVNRLDKDLPPFPLPKNLKIGRYTLVFHVLGEKDILDKVEKSVYFLDDAVFSLNDIQQYLPDVSNGSHLIPPGITVMLEAKIIADERLNPYVVWYSGKKRIGEGLISEGAGLIFWKAPEQTGFHTIRAEAFPRRPEGGIYGRSREISLPVSSKAANAGYFSGESEHIIYWYQFQGNLQDSRIPVATERALIPKGERTSQWAAQNNIYGLTVGSKDIYLLPAFSPIPGEKKTGIGRFMFRFKPGAEGTVFSVLLKSESPSDSVYMDLVLSKETLQLNITAPETSGTIPADYAPEEAEEFITLFIDFSAAGNQLAVNLNRENPAPAPPEPKIIVLSNPLSGEGSFQFGASLNTDAKAPDKADTSTSIPAEGSSVPVSAILDEFAVSWLETSPLPEEPVEVSDSVPPEEPEPDDVSEEEPPPEPDDLS
ncbi:MAG: hypothetical protein LBE14_04385 [Treponema sp.]|nr:hypothetical protein [Treponema sp.]